jgi:hypothetical protein
MDRTPQGQRSISVKDEETAGNQHCPSRRLSSKARRHSLVGMLMGRLRVPVGLLTMFVCGGGVLLGLVMLTNRMMVGRLVVMVRRSTVVRGSIVMVLARGVLVLVGHNRSPGWRLGGASASCWKAAWSTPPLFTISATLVPSSWICQQTDRLRILNRASRHQR